MATTALAPDVDLAPPEELQLVLKQRMGQLQMLPAVAQEALQLVRNPECSITQFTSVVKRDIKLTADVLKMTNSALYSLGTPLTDLNRCVLRIGFRECQYLILSASVASLMRRVPLAQQSIRDKLWGHSFTTALLASRLNRMFRLGFQGEEFSAGLLHDFGRILLAMIFPETFTDFDPLDSCESPDVLDREMEATGTDHCRLGAWFTHGNQIPAPIPSVILYHHQPELADKHQRLTALIATADQLANDWQRQGAGMLEDFSPPEALSLLISDETGEVAASLLDALPVLMHAVRQDAKAMMSAH